MKLRDMRVVAEKAALEYFRDSLIQIDILHVAVSLFGRSAILTGHEFPKSLRNLTIFEVSYFCGTATVKKSNN